MAETRRKKRKKPSQAVRRRRREQRQRRRDHREQGAAKVVHPRKAAPDKGKTDITINAAEHEGGGGGGGGGGSVSSQDIGAAVAATGAATGVGARGGSHHAATAAGEAAYDVYRDTGSQENAAYAASVVEGSYDTPEAANAKYRRQVRAHREHMQAIQKQIKVVQNTREKNKAEERKKLNELLKSDKRVKPEKPKDYLTRKQQEQGEKFFKILAGDPSEITRKLLGRSRVGKLERWGDAAIDFVRKQELTQKYGPPQVRHLEPAVAKVYKKSGPAKREAMRRAGLGPARAKGEAGGILREHGNRWLGTRHETLLGIVDEAAQKRQYHRRKRANVAARTPVFLDYRSLTEEQQESLAIKVYKERVGGGKLLPHERHLAEREGRALVETELDRSERALKTFGAFPAQGEKFTKALEDALDHGNPQQKALAHVWEHRLENADQQLLAQIDPGKGAFNEAAVVGAAGNSDVASVAQLYGLVERHDGKLVMVTGEDYGNDAWKRLKAKSDEKKEEERHQYDIGTIASNAWNNEIKPLFNPDTWRQIADVGIETVGQLPQRFLHSVGSISPHVNVPPPEQEKFDALKKAFLEQDAPIGFIQALMEGKSFDDAAAEFTSRAAESPLSTAGELFAGSRLARLGVMRAKYGTAARSVDAARPSYSVFDLAQQEKWGTMTPGERLKAVFARRKEARDAARARALAAKHEAHAQNRRQKRAAKDAGGPKPQHVSASDVLTAERTSDGQTRQFYFSGGPLRAGQKGKELYQVARGRDPFNKTGRQAGGYFDSRFGGEWRRRANRAIPFLRASNVRLGGEIAEGVRDLVYKPTRKFGVFAPNQLELAAFTLRYDGRVNPGTEAADLDKLIEVNRSYLDSNEMPKGATHTIEQAHEIAARNIRVLETLKEDLKWGPESFLHKKDLVTRVERLQAIGMKLDDALVEEGFVGEAAAAGRRASAGPMGRGEIVHVEEGDVLPGQAEMRETARAEIDVAKAVKDRRKAEAEAKEAAKPKRRKPVPEEKVRTSEKQAARDKAAKERRSSGRPQQPVPKPEEPPEFDVGDVGVKIRKGGHEDLKTDTGKAIVKHLVAEFKKGPKSFRQRVIRGQRHGRGRKGDFDWKVEANKLSAAGRDELLKQMRASVKIKAERARSPENKNLWKNIEQDITDEIARHAKETRAKRAMPKQKAEPRPPREQKPAGENVAEKARKKIQARAKVRLGMILGHVRGGAAYWRNLKLEGEQELKALGAKKEELQFPKIGGMSLQAQVNAYGGLIAEAKRLGALPGMKAQAFQVAVQELEKLRDAAQAKLRAQHKAEAKAEPKEPPEPETLAEWKKELGEIRSELDELRRSKTRAAERVRETDVQAEKVKRRERVAKLEKKILLREHDEQEAADAVRRLSPGEKKTDEGAFSEAVDKVVEARERVTKARATRAARLRESDDPVAQELRKADAAELAVREYIERHRGTQDRTEQELSGRPDIEGTELEQHRGGEFMEASKPRSSAEMVREGNVADVVGRLERLQEPVTARRPEWGVTIASGLSEVVSAPLRRLRVLMKKAAKGDVADPGHEAAEGLLAEAHEAVGGAAYRADAVERLNELDASWSTRGWAGRQAFEELSADQRAILHGMGVGIPGRRVPLSREVRVALADELDLSQQDLDTVIEAADVGGIAKAAVQTIQDARSMVVRRLKRGDKPQGEALDDFFEETMGERFLEDNAKRSKDFDQALNDLLKADEIIDPLEHRNALREIVRKLQFRRNILTVQGKDVADTRTYLAARVRDVAHRMITERAAVWHHEDQGVAEAEKTLSQIQARRRRVTDRLVQMLKSPMDTAKFDGWAWAEGPKLGQMFDEQVGGAFLDYNAVHRKFSRGRQELGAEASGPLRSADVVQLSDLTETDTIRASLVARVRLYGLQRMKAVLISMSPYKRAMDQDEAQELIDGIHRNPKNPRFVLVPIGKGGDIDPEDAADFLQGLDRPPQPGERVVPVPVAITRVFDEVTRPPGKLRAVSAYLSQKYVQASLPFSVLWHAGNVFDLLTRLAVAGVNPFLDRTLGRAWRDAVVAEDPVNGPEMFDKLVGHMGSREMVIRTATLGQALAGGKSQLSNALVALTDKLNRNRAVRLAQPLRYSSQRLFDFAGLTENFFVEHAMGSALRSMGRDLGYEMMDHVALAEKLLDEVHLNPELMEEFGQRTLSIVGDYTSSAFGQNVLQAIDPFWSWVRESARFVFFTFPAKHPIKFALAAALANAQEDVAERYGLDSYLDGVLGDMPQFLRGAFPVGGPLTGPLRAGMNLMGGEADTGWFRPTAPFTSWGETSKMLDNPLGYLAGRPLPYLQRTLSVARGHRSYNAIGEYALRNFQSWAGIELPGFDPPQTLPITEYTGNRSLGVLGELVKAFVPGANQVDEALRRNSLGTAEHNIFQPDPNDPTAIDDWWESRAINPFGKVRDLSSIGFELDHHELVRRYGRELAGPPPKGEHEVPEHKQLNEENRPNLGARMFTDRGNVLIWNGNNWVKGHPHGHERARPSQVKSKGSSKNVSKPSKERKDKALAKITKAFPELTEDDPRGAEAIADAARKYDVPAEVLASIFDVETDFGRSTLPGVHEGSNSVGAMGKMQFMPPTWDAYGVDATGDGKADPYDTVDAIHSAANYLKANGADNPDTLYDAIYAYNHADWYVQEVLAGAERFQTSKWIDAGVGRSVALAPEAKDKVKKIRGSWAGSRRQAMRAIPGNAIMASGQTAREEARHDKRTPEENSSVGGSPTSDHLTTNDMSYAADMQGVMGDGHADELAHAIADNLGMESWHGTNEVVKDGYRYQLIWQDDGHYDHVHLGVMWVGDSQPPTGTYAGGATAPSTTVAPSSSGMGYTVTGPGGSLPTASGVSHPGQQVVTGNPAAGMRLHHRWRRFETERMRLVMALLHDDIDEVEFVSGLKTASGMIGV